MGTVSAQGLGAIIAAMLLTACASAPQRIPIARAEQAIAHAVKNNAEATAGIDLRSGRTKLSKAKAAERNGDAERARRLAEQAIIDAQLAEAKAQAHGAERRASELKPRSTMRKAPAQVSRNP